jgi:hypothetical protein
MKLTEAVEALKVHSHAVLVCDEVSDYLDKLSAGDIDIPLPDGELLSPTAIEKIRAVVIAERDTAEKETEKIRGFDVVQKRKPRSKRAAKPKPKPRGRRKASG